MKSLLFISVISAFVSCNQTSSKAPIITPESEIAACIPCDLDTSVFNTYQNWTTEELSAFLCAFKKDCVWQSHLLHYRKGYYSGIALDYLFVLFEHNFENYLTALKDDDVDTAYLLTLYAQPAIYDLPYDGILEKLKSLPEKSALEIKLLEAFVKAQEAAID